MSGSISEDLSVRRMPVTSNGSGKVAALAALPKPPIKHTSKQSAGQAMKQAVKQAVKQVVKAPASVKRSAKPNAPLAAAKKATAPAKLAKATPSPAPKVRAAQEKQPKLVRDSFTMPQADHDLIKLCKKSAIVAGRETKKSEVVRAAIQAFAALTPAQRLAAYGKLQTIALGRPKAKG